MGVIVYLGFCATILLALVVLIFIVYWFITPMGYDNYVMPIKDNEYNLQSIIIAIIICVALGAGVFTAFVYNPNAFGYEKIVVAEETAESEP